MRNVRVAISAVPVAFAICVAGVAVVSAQDYPSKPVRILTSPAGGGGDFISRQVAQGITAALGQPVIVDNRASGFFAAEAVYKSPPDGYTLTIQGAVLWIYPLLNKVPYDSVRDFAPISLVVREVSIVAVHPSLPVKSVKELIALAKARPGDLNYASSISGGTSHLSTELFKSMAGANIVRIVYKGNAAAVTAVASGEVQVVIMDAGLISPHAKSGRLRALAVTSAQPSALTPGLPTVAASGLPGYEATGMTGMWAPAKTPEAIVNRLSQEVVRFLSLPDVKERLLNAGVEAVGTTPSQFAAIIKADIATVSKIIKDAGIGVDK